MPPTIAAGVATNHRAADIMTSVTVVAVVVSGSAHKFVHDFDIFAVGGVSVSGVRR
jgi:hypothetical protein